MSKKEKIISDVEIEDSLPELLYDGFGNSCSRICSQCGRQSMYINRPGDFRCRLCYEEKWVTVDLEDVLKTVSAKPAKDKQDLSKYKIKTKTKAKKKLK